MTRVMSTVEGMTQLGSHGGSRARRLSLALVSAGATIGLVAGMSAPAAATSAHHSNGFRQVDLVSDQPGVARLTDPGLVNAWGLSASPGTDAAPGSPLWVSAAETDKTLVYAGTSSRTVSKVLEVGVASGAPTGQVFNTDTTGFVVHDDAGHSAPAVFIFDSENGGIDGWNPTVGATGPGPSTTTEVAVRNGANAVYKGLAIGMASDGHTYLYAANFRSGRVEVYDDTFTPVKLPGGRSSIPNLRPATPRSTSRSSAASCTSPTPSRTRASTTTSPVTATASSTSSPPTAPLSGGSSPEAS